MKNHPKLRSAFTLVEMLVVIVIISLLALALISALKAAQRQAQAALCQAHLKNLHQACMNHLADTGTYPYAGSYEYLDNNSGEYSERKGWVSWVRDDGESGEEDSINPWKGEPKKSHAKDYLHVGFGGLVAEQAIKGGSIFRYTNRDMSTYRCKSFSTKQTVRRSYAMNNWFGSRRNELWRARRLLDFQKSGGNIEPSRMGYIIEIGPHNPSGAPLIGEQDDDGDQTAVVGEQARVGVADRKAIFGDSVWEHGDDECYGCYHRKAGAKHGHVIFVDGHIESLIGDEYGCGDATLNKKMGDATH